MPTHPLFQQLAKWLRYLSPKGPQANIINEVVVDFIGSSGKSLHAMLHTYVSQPQVDEAKTSNLRYCISLCRLLFIGR